MRSVAAQATFPPVKYEHTFALSGEHPRVRNARPSKTKHPYRLLRVGGFLPLREPPRPLPCRRRCARKGK